MDTNLVISSPTILSLHTVKLICLEDSPKRCIYLGLDEAKRVCLKKSVEKTIIDEEYEAARTKAKVSNFKFNLLSGDNCDGK